MSEVPEIELVFDYEKVLEEAKKRFTDKEVDSQRIFDWFNELRWTQFIHYKLLEKLMFKLRIDLWRWQGKDV